MSATKRHKAHILLVDDEEDFLRDLADFLREQDYRVDTAVRGEEAKARLEEVAYDLLVTDIRLPDLSGVELLRHTRAQYPATEGILITGYASKDSVLEALKLGAYDYIEKPFELLELLYSVVNCLEAIGLRKRNEALLEELRTHERSLERQVERKSAQVEAQDRKLVQVEALRQVVMMLTHSIQNASGTIWGYADLCRRMGKVYPEEVNRLIRACLGEGEKITADVDSLNQVLEDLEAEIADEPVPQQAPDVQAAPTPPAAEKEMESLYEALQAFVGGTVQVVQAGGAYSADRAYALVGRVTDSPQALDVLYRRAIYTRGGENSYGPEFAVVQHSVNVAVYALKIAEGLGYTRNQRIDLGVVCLLHDLGMVMLPGEIFAKGRLDEQDLAELHRHPEETRRLLLTLGPSYQWMADIAAQEHERADGSGYPHGLKGDQIHEFARILGVADTYAGLTRSRPGRAGLLPFEAVKEITQSHKHRFDARVVRVLLRKLSAFPIGSMVKLNSGAIGEVMETDETYPLRPVLDICYDAQGRPVEDRRIVNLKEYPILHIVRPVFEEDL